MGQNYPPGFEMRGSRVLKVYKAYFCASHLARTSPAFARGRV